MAEELQVDSVWTGADVVTMRGGRYAIIEQGALAVKADKLVWVGAAADMPAFIAQKHHRLAGGIITPGLVDCHTHLVFGGDRSQEFEQRLNGVSYADIAAQGGGFSLPFGPRAQPVKRNWLHRPAGG